MVPEQTITMTWTGFTKEYYIEKGYEYTGMRTTFQVKLEDLSKKSKKKITVICDYCHKPFYPMYANFMRNPNPPHSCNDCKHEKAKETCQKLYHVDNPMQLESVKEKSRKTSQERYQCDYPM